MRTNNCNLFIYRQTDRQTNRQTDRQTDKGKRKKDRFFTVSSPSFQILSFDCSMKTVYAEKLVLQMALEPSIWWEYELDFYLKSSLCQCSHRTRSGWLGLLSLSALWSHRGSGMRSHGSSALILGSTSPILSPELEQEQGIPSEFCYTLGWCWGSLMTSCLPVNVERKEKKYLIPVIHHLIMSFELSSVWLWKPLKFWVKSPPLGTQLYKPKSCL